ncbi:MAG: ATP synthase F0 subunit B [Nitrospinota bacterium]|nr:ATP synthase F0 subunit B [Nitrospinota bacterium]MDH5678785.1 ATP synthase F0 subunit B [Nitrospinota bacterium]MDH5756111.1 ATP synthase F0 subunit B [Nitrospinota bacterium]
MKNRYAALLAGATLFFAKAAWASGGLAMATEWSWARDGGRIFNSLVVVGAVVYIISRFAGPALKKRSKDIRDEIRELNEAREMAERNVADYQKKLEEIKAEHGRAMAEAKTEAEQIRQRILEQAEKAAQAVLSRASDQIDMETEQARQRLQKETTLLAIATAEELLKKNIGPADHKALLEEYISNMEKNN